DSFELELRLRANAPQLPLVPASVVARLEFAGLPAGARVLSCHGFDTRAQRGLEVPEVVAEPRQVTVRWPVDGPPGFSALVERSRWLAAGTSVVPLAAGRALAPGLYIVRLHYRDLVVRQTVVVLR